MQDEKQLVRRWQAGERRAFEEFVDAYGGRVHGLVRRYVTNPTDAEDVTQEVFCDLHRSIGSFRGNSALSTWVYRVTVNHCLRHCQKRKKRQPAPGRTDFTRFRLACRPFAAHGQTRTFRTDTTRAASIVAGTCQCRRAVRIAGIVLSGVRPNFRDTGGNRKITHVYRVPAAARSVERLCGGRRRTDGGGAGRH